MLLQVLLHLCMCSWIIKPNQTGYTTFTVTLIPEKKVVSWPFYIISYVCVLDHELGFWSNHIWCLLKFSHYLLYTPVYKCTVHSLYCYHAYIFLHFSFIQKLSLWLHNIVLLQCIIVTTTILYCIVTVPAFFLHIRFTQKLSLWLYNGF